jgi:hypothetical protein
MFAAILRALSDFTWLVYRLTSNFKSFVATPAAWRCSQGSLAPSRVNNVSSFLLLLRCGNGGRGPDICPGVGRLLVRNLAARRLVIVVELLLALLFLRRERTLLISLQRYTWHRHLCESACGQQGQRPGERYESAPPELCRSLSHCAHPILVPCGGAGLAWQVR